MNTNSLCWACLHSVPDRKGRGCSWSRAFQPIEGWKTETRIIKGEIYTVVKDCPQFVVHDDSRPSSRWISAEEAPALVGVSPAVIARWQKRTAIPTIKPFGYKIYLDRKALLRYAEKKRKEKAALVCWLKNHEYLNATQAAAAFDISTNELCGVLQKHHIEGVSKKKNYKIHRDSLQEIRRLILEERNGRAYVK